MIPLLLAALLSACAEAPSPDGSSQRASFLDQREQELTEKSRELEQERALLEEIKDLQKGLQLRLEAREIRLKEQEEKLEEEREKLDRELEQARKLREKLEARVRRGPAPAIVANRAIAVDANTGEILYEKNADKKGPVASTQKLLTALLIVEKGDLERELEIIPSDTRAAPTRLGLEVGERFRRRHLLTSLLVRSYNDVAEALARDHSGSVDEFCEAMNRRADELGMQASRFCNPHGLPNSSQYSTARDIARLALHVDQQSTLRKMVNLHGYELKRTDGRTVKLTNTNRVLRAKDWCDGMKTGYTRASGFCLVASGEHEGRRGIVVVLNSSSSAVWKDAEKLLAWSIEI